jgi:hypothetical protein
MKTVKELAWRKAYDAGRTAYLLGAFDDDNPYGKGNLYLYCAWFAGFCDRHTEEQGRGKPLPRRGDDGPGDLQADAEVA